MSFLTAVLMGVALTFHSLLEGAALGAQPDVVNSLHIFIAIQVCSPPPPPPPENPTTPTLHPHPRACACPRGPVSEGLSLSPDRALATQRLSGP